MLGNVVEGERRRFSSERDYLKNAHINQFKPPDIIAEDEQGEEILIKPDEKYYRFCFVEKNRIDSFARIAAQTPQKQIELISTLFGLDSFSEFVRNFTKEVDGKYIDLIGKKAEELAQKRQQLGGAEHQLKYNTEQLQIIEAEEQKLADNYREGTSFMQMAVELSGNGERLGNIEKLESDLQKPIPPRSNVTSENLITLRRDVDANIERLILIQKQLSTESQQVSFKQLYEAISQLQLNDSSQCPACKTQLDQVIVNPYSHAKQELRNLQKLGLLQEEEKRLQKNIQIYLIKFSEIINTCSNLSADRNILMQDQLQDHTEVNIEWYKSIFQVRHGYDPWESLLEQVKELERIDNENFQIIQKRDTKKAELYRLRNILEEATKLKARKDTAKNAIKAAQLCIQNFDTVNAQLISDVESEKIDIKNNKAIVDAYKDFLEKLMEYNKSLPKKLIADLGDLVLELYNAFNRNDTPNDLLAKVRLPWAENQRLEISFCTKPEIFYDALHVLSEGHIRCMGLALLLAKNIKEQCPLLIFDDPINAIDDEHRESIRLTLFKDKYFSNKQIILACHGEEFFKDIQNLFPREMIQKKCQLLTFMSRLDDQHIRIDFECASRNYIIAARECFNRGEVRDSLGKSRQALESLTRKVWLYIGRKGDASLSIKLRAPKAAIELRNLAEQLKFKIDQHHFYDENKNLILQPLKELLSLDGASREWQYLNKGTHEESDCTEFDRSIVSKIISNLEKLDEALA